MHQRSPPNPTCLHIQTLTQSPTQSLRRDPASVTQVNSHCCGVHSDSEAQRTHSSLASGARYLGLIGTTLSSHITLPQDGATMVPNLPQASLPAPATPSTVLASLHWGATPPQFLCTARWQGIAAQPAAWKEHGWKEHGCHRSRGTRSQCASFLRQDCGEGTN